MVTPPPLPEFDPTLNAIGPGFGTIVGRVSSREVCVLTDHGWRVTLRVSSEVASRIGVGQRAELIHGASGWPESLVLIGA
jgi:hypothetical protein